MPYLTDLIEFDQWLKTKRMHTTRSATAQCSHVRRALLHLGTTAKFGPGHWTQEEVEGVLNYGAPQASSNRRSAWNNYVDYALEVEGIQHPRPRSPSQAKQKGEPMPVETLKALVHLMVNLNVKATVINRLSWRHVNIQPNGVGYLVDPLWQKGVSTQLTREVVDGLKQWAKPADGDVPLVPVEPGGRAPMPVRMIREAFQAYVRTL